MSPDGSHQRPVVSDAGGIEPGVGGYGLGVPKLSPDGRRVLLPRNGIAVVTLATGATRQITTSKSSDEGYAVWSPDSQAIAYANGDSSRILVNDLRTGKTRTIVNKDSQPVSWSPDGKWVLIMRYFSDFKARLWVVGSDGTGLRLITNYVPVGDVSWRSNSEIEFAGVPYEDDNSRSRLIRIDLRTNEVTKLAELGYISALVWSPDGQHFAYTANDVYVRNKDGRERHRLKLPNLDPIDNQQLAWSPDSKNLVATRYDNFYNVGGGAVDQLWAVRADGSRRRQLTQAYPDGLQNVVPLWTNTPSHR